LTGTGRGEQSGDALFESNQDAEKKGYYLRPEPKPKGLAERGRKAS